MTGRERQPKKGKGVKPGPGRPLEVKGKDAGSRDLAGGAVLPSPGKQRLCFGLSRKHIAHKSNSVKCSVKIKWLHLVAKLENSIV